MTGYLKGVVLSAAALLGLALVNGVFAGLAWLLHHRPVLGIIGFVLVLLVLGGAILNPNNRRAG